MNAPLREVAITSAPRGVGRRFAVEARYDDRTLVLAYTRSLNDAVAIVLGLVGRMASEQAGARP